MNEEKTNTDDELTLSSRVLIFTCGAGNGPCTVCLPILNLNCCIKMASLL